MKKLILLTSFLYSSFSGYAQTYVGPVPAVSGGYGVWGNNEVVKDSVKSPLFPGRYVDVFHAKFVTTARPTIFFAHGFGGNQSDLYLALLRFLASKGYTVVFSPYQTVGNTIDDRYNTLWEGFVRAVETFPQYIDQTKVGFAGHSFGAGALFNMGQRAFVEEGWGSKGRFLFSMAPWYLYGITQTQLQNYPKDVKLLIQVYEDDAVNDHRIAVDAFNNVGIPNAEKDYVIVPTDAVAGYAYTADHSSPASRSGVYDAIDSWAIFRLIDALADYALNGKIAGKSTALGNGSLDQITMPSYQNYNMKTLRVTDNPQPLKPESFYSYPCSNILNPRKAFCGQTTPVSETFALETSVYPNPVSDRLEVLHFSPTPQTQMVIYNAMGQKIFQQAFTNEIMTGDWQPGIYTLILSEGVRSRSWRVLKL